MSFAQAWRQPNRFFCLARALSLFGPDPLPFPDGALDDREPRVREREPGIQFNRLFVKVLRSLQILGRAIDRSLPPESPQIKRVSLGIVGWLDCQARHLFRSEFRLERRRNLRGKLAL